MLVTRRCDFGDFLFSFFLFCFVLLIKRNDEMEVEMELSNKKFNPNMHEFHATK